MDLLFEANDVQELIEELLEANKLIKDLNIHEQIVQAASYSFEENKTMGTLKAIGASVIVMIVLMLLCILRKIGQRARNHEF